MKARNDIIISKYSEKKEDTCYCSKYEGLVKKKDSRIKSPSLEPKSRLLEKGKKIVSSTPYSQPVNCRTMSKSGSKLDEVKSNTCRPINDFSDTSSNSSGSSLYSVCNNEKEHSCNKRNAVVNSAPELTPISSCDCCNGTQIDCGYGSADNNIISSSNGSGDSSVDSSEVACSEGFCNHDGEFLTFIIDLIIRSTCFILENIII